MKQPCLMPGAGWGLDPLHEPVHQALMQLYAQTGQQAAALRQYEECVRLLDAELGIRPDEETTGLYAAIKAKRIPAPRVTVREQSWQEVTPISLEPSMMPDHNLPPQPTSFVGRETELAEIRQLILEESALSPFDPDRPRRHRQNATSHRGCPSPLASPMASGSSPWLPSVQPLLLFPQLLTN